MASGWEIRFRLACLERRGEAYQELFAEIMERRDVGFQRVRPWGSQGDRKNDGWSPERRMLFQSYAPSTLSVSALTAKLTEDYEGAAAYWKDFFDHWVFVHDDLAGMAPEVARQIAELNASSNDITCAAWGYMELREEFALLAEANKRAILGPPLTPGDFIAVDVERVRPLIEHLGRQQPDPNAEVRPVPPNKIEANQLTVVQVEFLRLGAARAPLVERFLSDVYLVPTVADEIAEGVAARYRALKLTGQAPSEILDQMILETGGASDTGSLAGALAVISYFFERCHIFEVPAEIPA